VIIPLLVSSQGWGRNSRNFNGQIRAYAGRTLKELVTGCTGVDFPILPYTIASKAMILAYNPQPGWDAYNP